MTTVTREPFVSEQTTALYVHVSIERYPEQPQQPWLVWLQPQSDCVIESPFMALHGLSRRLGLPPLTEPGTARYFIMDHHKLAVELCVDTEPAPPLHRYVALGSVLASHEDRDAIVQAANDTAQTMHQAHTDCLLHQCAMHARVLQSSGLPPHDIQRTLQKQFGAVAVINTDVPVAPAESSKPTVTSHSKKRKAPPVDTADRVHWLAERNQPMGTNANSADLFIPSKRAAVSMDWGDQSLFDQRYYLLSRVERHALEHADKVDPALLWYASTKKTFRGQPNTLAVAVHVVATQNPHIVDLGELQRRACQLHTYATKDMAAVLLAATGKTDVPNKTNLDALARTGILVTREHWLATWNLFSASYVRLSEEEEQRQLQ